jgi:nucleoside-diphosphate-sugar epimerase
MARVQARSFCYVNDLITGLVRLMATLGIGPINLGNPIEFSVLELAKTMVDLKRETRASAAFYCGPGNSDGIQPRSR